MTDRWHDEQRDLRGILYDVDRTGVTLLAEELTSLAALVSAQVRVLSSAVPNNSRPAHCWCRLSAV